MTEIIEKHPDGSLKFEDFDFTDDLPDDTSLAVGSSVSAVDSSGAAAASVIGTVGQTGMVLHVILQAGTNGEDYLITFKAVGGTTARVAVKQLEMRVRTKITGSL